MKKLNNQDVINKVVSLIQKQRECMSVLITYLIELLLEKKCPKRKQKRVDKKKRLKKSSLSKNSTQKRKPIAEWVKREVMKKSEYQCAFVGADGNKCGSTHDVEIDHIKPLSLGGGDEIENLRVLCREHNLFEAKRLLGSAVIDSYCQKESRNCSLPKILKKEYQP